MSNKPLELFKTGVEFLYPRSEQGPSLYALLEAAWTIPAIIQGVRTRVWETAEAGRPDAVAATWAKMGLIGVDENGKVLPTEQGLAVARCVELLEYEMTMMQRQLDGNTATDPALYEKLRSGLAHYTQEFLPHMLKWVRGCAEAMASDLGTVSVLDYCGGDGVYIRTLAAEVPQVDAWLMDRAVGPTRELANAGVTVRIGDVLTDAEMTEDLTGFFNIIIMSEILHCKGKEDREKMLQQAYDMLAPGGVLLVIEQYPNSRLEWRMQDMTNGGHCLNPAQVAYEVKGLPFGDNGMIEGFTHYGIVFNKLEAQQ